MLEEQRSLEDLEQDIINKYQQSKIDPEQVSRLFLEDINPLVIIPEFKFGTHSYPEMDISLFRVSSRQYSDLEDTCKDLRGKPSIGNMTPEKAKALTQKLEGYYPSVVLGRQHILNLKRALNNKNYHVYFSHSKKQVPISLLRIALDDILKETNPYRSELFDTKFGKEDGLQQITYPVFDSEELVYVTEELDKDTLMQDKTPGISLDSWLDDSKVTPQALPRKNIEKGDLYYFFPRDGSVARFVAYSGRACLDCDGDPGGSDARLGVRYMRLRAQN